jgi:hypothetical protein
MAMNFPLYVALLLGRHAPNPIRASTSPPLTPDKFKVAAQCLTRATSKRRIRLVAVGLPTSDNRRLSSSGARIATLLAFLASADDH